MTFKPGPEPDSVQVPDSNGTPSDDQPVMPNPKPVRVPGNVTKPRKIAVCDRADVLGSARMLVLGYDRGRLPWASLRLSLRRMSDLASSDTVLCAAGAQHAEYAMRVTFAGHRRGR